MKLFRNRIALPIIVLVLIAAVAVWWIASRPNAPTPSVVAPVNSTLTADAAWERAQKCACPVIYSMPEMGPDIVLKAINSAQKSIRLKIYLFTRDDVRDALVAAAKRGIDVRAIVELNVSGGAATNVDMFNSMKNTGVKWQWASYDFRFTHEKSIVIDERIGLIMTYNMTTTAFKNTRGYGVIDPVLDDVSEMVKVYEADWQKVPIDLGNARLVWSPINSRKKWIELIDTAKTSLEMTQEEWLSQEIVGHVADAAKRGVKVRVILPPSENRPPFDQTPFYDLVRASGGEFKFMDEPRMVGKITIVDGKRALVGSENVSNNSLDNNRELGIIFDQPDAIAFLRSAFESDWKSATDQAYPVSDAPIPANGIVMWKDAAKYYNRDVTVEGTVVKVYNSGRVMWLQFSDNPDTDMKVVIFPSDWGKFPQRPDKLFADKTIRATGRVVKFQGAPEMIVNNPGQIVTAGDPK